MKKTAQERNNARLYAAQALYQKKINDDSFEDLKVQFFSDNASRHKTDWDFFYKLMDSVAANEEKIRQLIAENSAEGPDLINYVDLSVLEVAIAEMIDFMENPYQIIIKEHVQIAYSMGTEKGYLFVNALLDAVAKEVRVLEYIHPESSKS